MAAKTTSHGDFYYRGGRLFAMRRQPPKQQPFLVVMPVDRPPDEARVLVDPGEIDAKGTTAIDWYVPSPDGKLVAVSLSKGGTETGDPHLRDAGDRQGKLYEVKAKRVNGGTAGGDLVWAADGKGFYYPLPIPAAMERPAVDLDFFSAGVLPRPGNGRRRKIVDRDGKVDLALHRRDQVGGGRRHRPRNPSRRW